MAGRQRAVMEKNRQKKERERENEEQADRDKELEIYKQKKQGEDLAKMRREIAEAQAAVDEEARLERVRNDERKLGRAKNVMETMLAKAPERAP